MFLRDKMIKKNMMEELLTVQKEHVWNTLLCDIVWDQLVLFFSLSLSLTLNHSFRLLAGVSLKEPEFSSDFVSPLCRCWWMDLLRTEPIAEPFPMEHSNIYIPCGLPLFKISISKSLEVEKSNCWPMDFPCTLNQTVRKGQCW